MNYRNVFEVSVGLLAVGTLIYVLINDNRSNTLEEGPISVVDVIPPETFDGSGDFTFVFHKHREDCTNPFVFRTFVNLESGQPTTVKDALDMHIQYPINTNGEPHKLVVPIVAPDKQPDPGQTFMITEICYTCNNSRVCNLSTSPLFEVLP